MFYFSPANGPEVLMAASQLVLSVALGLGVIVSAFLAWKGISGARYALAMLIVIHYGLVAYLNYQMAIWDIAEAGDTIVPWGRAIRSIVTAAIIAWYLLFSRGATEFFEKKPLAEPA
jgi:hypothetical protein